jgi:hypothetical protein
MKNHKIHLSLEQVVIDLNIIINNDNNTLKGLTLKNIFLFNDYNILSNDILSTSLTRLELNNTLDQIPKSIEFIIKLHKLKYLSLIDCSYDTNNIINIIKHLKKLICLEIIYNKIKQSNTNQLIKECKKHLELKLLKIKFENSNIQEIYLK